MISKVRDDLIKIKDCPHHFRFNGARNQQEEFDGIIDGIYNYIFTIRTNNQETKSFSYSDVLIGNLEVLN